MTEPRRYTQPAVNNCPCCGSNRVMGLTAMEVTRYSMEQDIACQDCDLTWTEVIAFSTEEVL